MPKTGDDDHYVEGAWGTLAEQEDESFYDDRSDANDDMEKSRIKFPKGKLYGRDPELERLWRLYREIEGNPISVSSESFGNGDQESFQNQKESASADVAEGSSNASPRRCSSRVVFIGGYSGMGKSALVTEFVRQVTDEKRQASFEPPQPLLHTSGKYSSLKSTTAPFLAIAEAFQKLASELLRSHNKEHPDDKDSSLLSKIRGAIEASEVIGPQTEGGRALRGAFPGVAPLFSAESAMARKDSENMRKLQNGEPPHQSSEPSPILKMSAVKEPFLHLVSIICTSIDRPFLLFLDDVQWADESSFEILHLLLSDKSLDKFMAICAYRSNEISLEHPLLDLMKSVRDARNGSSELSDVSTDHMELYNLSSDVVGQFIADSIHRENAEQVASLTEVIYSKTMGNIFYVIQCMEELVRKNALYYDVMEFQWKWNVSKVQMENYLSGDVMDTVKNKIEGLSKDIQRLLIVMAYVPNAMDTSTLQELLSGEGIKADRQKTTKLLKQAIAEGMVIQTAGSKKYAFGHDRIQEVSHGMIPPGPERDDLVVRISNILIERGSSSALYEWMLYVAVDHLNLVSSELISRIRLANLNLLVAKIAMSQDAPFKANGLLRAGLACLESSSNKWKDYELTLDLYNNSIISEHSLGFFDEANAAIEEVLKNAKSLEDKFTAHFYKIEGIGSGESRNYTLAAQEGIRILNTYGQNMPIAPKAKDFLNEKFQLKLALRKRPLSCLTNLPKIEEDSVFQLLHKVMMYSSFSRNEDLGSLVYYRTVRLALQKGICYFVPAILAFHAKYLVGKGDLKQGYKLGSIASTLSSEFRGSETYFFSQVILFTGIIPHFQPFRSSCGVLFASFKNLRLTGNYDTALLCGLGCVNSVLASGFPLDYSLISNLLLMEDYANISGRTMMTASFQMIRQFSLNLMKVSKNPTEFVGEVFNETQALEGMNRNDVLVTFRDISIYRLQLAFILLDDTCMGDMLKRLSCYQSTDLLVSRMHVRLCYTGLVAFYLRNKKKDRSYLKTAKVSFNFFQKLVKMGSQSARPVYYFLEALKNPSTKAFDKAIEICSELKLFHLEAMANEHCGLFLERDARNPEHAQEYLSNAYWLYHDWRAGAKTQQMSEKYEFLRGLNPRDRREQWGEVQI